MSEKLTGQQAIDRLMEYEGLDERDLMSIAGDSVHPGICVYADCENTQECEPDARGNICDACGRSSVISLGELFLAGYFPSV